MTPSPEERLLSLIRGKPAPPPGGGGPLGRAGEAAAAATTSGTATLRPAIRWPRLVAAGLCAVLAAEAVYLAVQLTQPLPEVTVPPIPPPAIEAGTGETSTAPAQLPAMPSLAASASRPLFASATTAAASASSGSGVAQAGPSGLAKALAARLTLLGVVAGDPPQVIIEDAETKKTFFVSTGQSVVEGAVVEQVLDNRVILDLAGEKIDLSL